MPMNTSDLLNSLLSSEKTKTASAEGATMDQQDAVLEGAWLVLEKTAAAHGIDLEQLADEEVAQALAEIAQDPDFPEMVKEASADEGELAAAEEQYELGRLMGLGMADGFAEGMDKTAGYDDADEQILLDLAHERAYAIAALFSENADPDLGEEALEKTASYDLDDETDVAITILALAELEQAGYDVAEIVEASSQL